MKTYLRHKIDNLIEIKELIALEFLNFQGKYKDYTEKHNFWELCYVREGKVNLKIEDKEILLKKGNLYLISPNKYHTYLSIDYNPSVYVVCFESFSQSLLVLSDMILYTDSLLLDCMERIIDEGKNTFLMNENEQLEVLEYPIVAGQQMIINRLEYMLIYFFREISNKEKSKIVLINGDNFKSEIVDEIKLYLRENYNKKITLNDICERFSYSRAHLCKIFLEETGETIISYFNKLKLNRAKKLLKNTNHSVTEISVMLGYSEVKYFDTIFKKQIGLTPIEYRLKETGN